MRKMSLILCIALILCLFPGVAARGEAEERPFDFGGATWGMTRDEVKALMPSKPLQEPVTADGLMGLIYSVEMHGAGCVMQYSFTAEEGLYNIMYCAPDRDKAFYDASRAMFESRCGAPLTADDAGLETDDPAAVMLTLMMAQTTDTDFLGWNADDQTVIVQSWEPTQGVTYVEIRLYTHYFQIIADPG